MSTSPTDAPAYNKVPPPVLISDFRATAAVLIKDPSLVDGYIADKPEPLQAVIRSTVQKARMVNLNTEWDADVLLDRFGCSDPDLQHEEDEVLMAQFEHSDRFLSFVLVLTDKVETTQDRRAVVTMCSHLVWSTGCEISDLEQVFSNGTEANQLLMLGEVPTATQAALYQLQPARLEGIMAPFSETPFHHLSDSRIQLLVEGRLDLIGSETMYRRIMEHIEECGVCASDDRLERVRHGVAAH